MAIGSSAHLRSLGLLVVTTLVWGTTFPLVKDVVNMLSPSVLMGSRFAIAALAFLPFFRSIHRQLLYDGLILGIFSFVAYLTQVIGLESTSSNRAAFITSLNVVLVPLLGLFLGRSVAAKVLVAAGLALAGIGVMSWEGQPLGQGDFWMFGCALSYAVYILLLESIAPRHNPLSLTAVQLVTVAIGSLIWAFPDLIRQLPQLQVNFGTIVYLGLIATAATTWTQAVAQRDVSATETAIVYTLEPVFAAVFAFWWLGERLGNRGLLGAGMVLVAMLLSQISFKRDSPIKR